MIRVYLFELKVSLILRNIHINIDKLNLVLKNYLYTLKRLIIRNLLYTYVHTNF